MKLQIKILYICKQTHSSIQNYFSTKSKHKVAERLLNSFILLRFYTTVTHSPQSNIFLCHFFHPLWDLMFVLAMRTHHGSKKCISGL